MAAKVHVAGYRAKIDDPEVFVGKLRSVSETVGEAVEAYDAGIVLGAEHVAVAWERAERAHATGRAVAGSVAMEARLFISCEGQIKSAMASTGVERGSGGVVLASVSERALDEAAKALGLRRDDSVLDPTTEKLVAWGIDAKRPELIFERMSLLEVER
jgi:tRNA threonylcarbamoyladenosine modification (KEOPS) complex Cgi121 subunit